MAFICTGTVFLTTVATVTGAEKFLAGCRGFSLEHDVISSMQKTENSKTQSIEKGFIRI
jgi:hypothetical protein